MSARTDAGRITDCQFNRDEDKIIIIMATEYTVWPGQGGLQDSRVNTITNYIIYNYYN